MFPVLFEDSQIPMGGSWRVICPLEANRCYHVYLYGEWINTGSDPKTDYDIYVYNPLGELECYSTEAAGLPECLSGSPGEAFFAPKHSGNYTFLIVNDARESRGSQQATLMVIEHVECNVWHEHYVEGKDSNGEPVFHTSWAYEFTTESQNIEVWVRVPETLDMYEVRLYLMTDPKSANKTLLKGVPIPWEPGLYGEVKDKVGGYNLESKGHRGAAYASCENYGQDMFLNFSLPSAGAGKNLYHLVFIGEAGKGTIKFLVKTKFDGAYLKPLKVPEQAYPGDNVTVAYISEPTSLENATLSYTTDGWANVTTVSMTILEGRICQAVIPGQAAGTTVNYRIEAVDALLNPLNASGSYTVKYASAINLTCAEETATVNKNVTVKGALTPKIEGQPIRVTFTLGNETVEVPCSTLENGAFSVSFKPERAGLLIVEAAYAGNSQVYGCAGGPLVIKVEEQPLIVQYTPYIGVICSMAVIVVIIVHMVRARG
ncbi:MAG: hypothetical protein RMJ15_09595 [Nitrososphaerota archaeon]|nr:hypothetical protein [Candidatus Bathyarchaeota archaeon]MDW8023969.1 hypothetical protein [Nitrososphaerota archaeon]